MTKIYKYASIIQTQDLDGTPLTLKGVILGKWKTHGCNIAPMTPGKWVVFHVEKLPYPMDKETAWEYLNNNGKSIYDYCKEEKQK